MVMEYRPSPTETQISDDRCHTVQLKCLFSLAIQKNASDTLKLLMEENNRIVKRMNRCVAQIVRDQNPIMIEPPQSQLATFTNQQSTTVQQLYGYAELMQVLNSSRAHVRQVLALSDVFLKLPFEQIKALHSNTLLLFKHEQVRFKKSLGKALRTNIQQIMPLTLLERINEHDALTTIKQMLKARLVANQQSFISSWKVFFKFLFNPFKYWNKASLQSLGKRNELLQGINNQINDDLRRVHKAIKQNEKAFIRTLRVSFNEQSLKALDADQRLEIEQYLNRKSVKRQLQDSELFTTNIVDKENQNVLSTLLNTETAIVQNKREDTFNSRGGQSPRLFSSIEGSTPTQTKALDALLKSVRSLYSPNETKTFAGDSRGLLEIVLDNLVSRPFHSKSKRLNTLNLAAEEIYNVHAIIQRTVKQMKSDEKKGFSKAQYQSIITARNQLMSYWGEIHDKLYRTRLGQGVSETVELILADLIKLLVPASVERVNGMIYAF